MIPLNGLLLRFESNFLAKDVQRIRRHQGESWTSFAEKVRFYAPESP
jgi:hypothetical protein